jgi:hypothetical protein
MTRDTWLATCAVLIFLAVVLAGCSPQRCYDLVGINPPAGTYIAFDGCSGVVVLRSFAAPSTTTTTTIPPTAF